MSVLCLNECLDECLMGSIIALVLFSLNSTRFETLSKNIGEYTIRNSTSYS